MGCGVVERHLEMAQPKKKNYLVFTDCGREENKEKEAANGPFKKTSIKTTYNSLSV